MRVFRLSIVAALATSPIVWNHYLVLLYVPLALTRPRFSPVWLLGSWVLGIEVLDRRALVISAAAVWLVILIQSGLTPGRALSYGRDRLRFVHAALPFVASIGTWAALLWLVGAVTAAIPGLAALTPPTRGGVGSGTATLRVLKAKNEICWKIFTSGLPGRTRAEILTTNPDRVLIERTMRSGRSDACGDYAPMPGEDLATAFRAGRVHLVLRVTSATGRPLLSGGLVSKLQQLKVTSAAGSAGS
jgi:hypothetical protein